MIAWWILMERDMEEVEAVARSIFSLYKLSTDDKSGKTGLFRAKEYLQSAYKKVTFNVTFEEDFEDKIKFTILPENEMKDHHRKQRGRSKDRKE